MASTVLSTDGTVTPYPADDREFGRFSDHVTVWIDKYIGEENTYEGLKTKFNENIQVLQSNNPIETEIDDDSMLWADQNMLKKLEDDVYCLKYFATIEKALIYIHQNPDKKIFFISSGTIGKEVVPQIAGLPQIKGIYIFCGDISQHTAWAGEYIDYISSMLEHQDNLLERLTRDMAQYLEEKGDGYRKNESIIAARNCFAWAKKLLIRGRLLGDTGSMKLIENIERKLNEVQSFAAAPSEN